MKKEFYNALRKGEKKRAMKKKQTLRRKRKIATIQQIIEILTA